MKTHMRFSHDPSLTSTELGLRLTSQIVDKYGIDPRLASEMAWDLLELLDAIDGNLDTLDKFFLH